MKDWYDNIKYILWKVLTFVFTVEGAYIYIYCRMYVFILQKRNFVVAICITPWKTLESPGIMSKLLEKSWNFDAKSPRKNEKKSWKVLESPRIWINFFGGNHVIHLHRLTHIPLSCYLLLLLIIIIIIMIIIIILDHYENWITCRSISIIMLISD